MNVNTPAYTSEDYDPQDRHILLGFLFTHKLKLLIQLFRDREIRVRSRMTRVQFQERVEELLDSGEIDLGVIVEILNELEGWGRQQIYLYDFEGGQTQKNRWMNAEWVRDHFENQGLGEIFNVTRPIVTPDEPTLISIEYSETDHRIRFIWVQKRTTVQRSEDDDLAQDEFTFSRNSAMERIIYRAYREITVRGVISFDWEIGSGDGMLLIRKLRGTTYKNVRDEIMSELRGYGVPVDDFTPLSISAVITALSVDNDEVVRRSMEFRTTNNEGQLSFSSGNQRDVFEDRVLNRARRDVTNDITGLTGRIRWKARQKKYINIELYGKVENDQRIGIGAQELQEDIRHVLRRIRTYRA